MTEPEDRPPLQRAAALRQIDRHRIEWVLSGSLVLIEHGARITPNDLDLVPEPSIANLERVCDLLRDLDAVPAYFADWPGSLTLEECRSWQAGPDTQVLDHLFVTTVGMIDVPPSLTGTYDHLMRTATRRMIDDVEIWMCDPREVLSRIPNPPRAKDRERAAEYARVRAVLDG